MIRDFIKYYKRTTVFYFILVYLIPVLILASPVDKGGPFRWERDELFSELERIFLITRALPDETARAHLTELTVEGEQILNGIVASGSIIPYKLLGRLENIQFRIAALAASKGALLKPAHKFINKSRVIVMKSAARWPGDERAVKDALYRVIYGGRVAIEEALSVSVEPPPSLTRLEEVTSSAPYSVIEGVRVHSGDIVISRGGAPTSALIARGGDFPGNFSHAAIVYVDPESKKAFVVESILEKGTVVKDAAEFLKEKRYRLLLLRMRPDAPLMKRDPLLPHRAAEKMFRMVNNDPLPYDFAMDMNDGKKLFCTELVYRTFKNEGIDLLPLRSRMSSKGLVNWLGSLGVEYFTAISPSDLEYDSRLAPVVEWRNVDSLRDDRLDNLVIDALLESADRGTMLGYPYYLYPVATAAKLWSVAGSYAGQESFIPMGMSVPAALRVRSLTEKIFPVVKEKVENEMKSFRVEYGYYPPYWKLLDLANRIVLQQKDNLYPALIVDDGGA